MSNNRGRKDKPHPKPTARPSPTTNSAVIAQGVPATTEQAAQAIEFLAPEAEKLSTENQGIPSLALEMPPPPAEIDLVKIWLLAQQSKETFDRAAANAAEAEKSAKAREQDAKAREQKARELSDAVEKRGNEFKEQRAAQQKIKDEIDIREKDLKRREQKIVSDEGLIKEREIEAEAGFLNQRRQSLTKLDEEVKSLAQKIPELQQAYFEEIRKYKIQLEQIREQELANIEQERQTVETEKRQVSKLKREADWARLDAEELKASWVSKFEERVHEAVADRDRRLQSALTRCEELARQLSRHEELERIAGGKSREQLMVELTSLRERNAELLSQLAQKPSDDQVAELSNLQRTKETLLSDLRRLQQENQTLKLQVHQLDVGVTELQALRDQKVAWESRERAWRGCVDELKRDLGELVEKSKTQHVFPSLIAMDAKVELQTPPDSLRERLPSLKDWAKEIQERIAGVPHYLYYSERDIRTFLAGLACSRLHLLQGISGTGKTSLPRAFAKVIGADSALIEVQSGWRDRNDLLGYYNAFERRFYESEFLKALYRAQLPYHENRPFFIVLDEMNLSHPEHYFADFLSALELTPQDQRISLLTAKVEGSPRLLEDGQRLRIPPNVWFIGTANQDETTKGFASKTYDRSHMMEFPRHPAEFSPKAYNRAQPVTVKAIEDAFRHAVDRHKQSAMRLKSFLNDSLSEPMAQLQIGWGNRLERQIDRFVPVFIETGGSLGEAADHILATKLLRQLKGKYDLQSKQLGDFQNQLLNAWKGLDEAGLPEKCAVLLEAEIKGKNRVGSTR